MNEAAGEAAHQGYAADRIPDSAQGSGWRIFFIVAGSMCGLPVFILSARIFGSLGFEHGMEAVLLGTTIAAILGACSAWCGSRTRMGLAMLADQAFGPWGARTVKLVIAIALVGWFGVNIGVLGATAATAFGQMSGWHVPALLIGMPVCVAIAATAIRGATSLERIGIVLVPATAVILALSVWLVRDRLGAIWARPAGGGLNFGGAVSAVVGSYVVGIVIQPDYGRFVRRPAYAAVGTASALGIAYPLVMLCASIASLSLGAPEVVSAMILLGFGIPALAVLILGAWIDSSACLYSASLSFANQMPGAAFPVVVSILAVAGATLVVIGADTAFIPFLTALGVSLPPLACILILTGLSPEASCSSRQRQLMPLIWAVGTSVGIASIRGTIKLTELPALDSILSTAIGYTGARLLLFGWPSRAATPL